MRSDVVTPGSRAGFGELVEVDAGFRVLFNILLMLGVNESELESMLGDVG